MGLRELAPALALAALVACPRPGPFRCVTGEQCGPAGTGAACEPSGYCSFADGTCPSGRRYGDGAAEGHAAACVDPGGPDGGSLFADGAPGSDGAASPDAPPADAAVCGDGRCDPGETCAACELDCGPCCEPACSAGDVCHRGVCCVPPPADYAGVTSGGMAYANWDFPAATTITELEHRICFLNDPTPGTSIYYQFYDYPLDGTGQYYGLQTDASGRRIIWSRWGTSDEANARVAAGGWIVSGAEGGAFVGLRFPYAWTTGCYRVRAARAEGGVATDWFDLYVRREDEPAETYVGGLRFPRQDTPVRATFADGGGTWLEVYSYPSSIFDIAYSHFSIATTANGTVAPVHALSSYAERPNADVWWDGTAVHFEIGGHTPRCHPAGLLF